MIIPLEKPLFNNKAFTSSLDINIFCVYSIHKPKYYMIIHKKIIKRIEKYLLSNYSLFSYLLSRDHRKVHFIYYTFALDTYYYTIHEPLKPLHIPRSIADAFFKIKNCFELKIV